MCGCGILVMGTVSWGWVPEPWYLAEFPLIAERYQCQRNGMSLHETGFSREGQTMRNIRGFIIRNWIMRL